jgi:hypothetical protein
MTITEIFRPFGCPSKFIFMQITIHSGDGPTFAATVHPLNWPEDDVRVIIVINVGQMPHMAFLNPNRQNGKKEKAKNAEKFGPAKSGN